MQLVETLSAIRKVLVVENEIIIADDIAMTVAGMGCFPLDPVFDFYSAINAYNAHAPDLVIIDIRLQGKKTGIEFAKWIRSSFSTPIIYVTVIGSSVMRQEAELTQPSAYLVKPFHTQELIEAVGAALN
tara:strand:+ start:5960 stop:6346 length:387 start_codon:yes stop_codon:yes gene_type:complete